MKAGETLLDKDEIQMATVLLLFLIYYPKHPPLKSFVNLSFQGKKDNICLVESGLCIFADIENCSGEQLDFMQEKVKEVPELLLKMQLVSNGVTRVSIVRASV